MDAVADLKPRRNSHDYQRRISLAKDEHAAHGQFPLGGLVFFLAVVMFFTELAWGPFRRFFRWLSETSDEPDPFTFRFCSLCGGNSVEPLEGVPPIGKAGLPFYLETTFGEIDDFGRTSIILPGEWLHGFCIECRNFVRSIFPEGTAASLGLSPPSEKELATADPPLVTAKEASIILALGIFFLVGYYFGQFIHASEWAVLAGGIFGLMIGDLAIQRGRKTGSFEEEVK